MAEETELMEEKVHDLFGASVLERRMLCPGSAAQEKPYYALPDDDPGHGQRDIGTRNHEVAARVISGEGPLEDFLDPGDDQYLPVRWYLDQVEDIRRRFNGRGVTVAELEIDMRGIHPVIRLPGTVDFGVYVYGKYGWIADMKNCHTPVTPADRNVQLAAYAVAFADTFRLQQVKVSLFNTVNFWQSHHVYDRQGLEAVRLKLHQAVQACLSPWAPCVPGEKQCQYCRAWMKCPATLAAVPALARIGVPVEKDPKDMTRAELCRLWRLARSDKVQALISYIGKIENHVVRLVKAGVDLTEYGIGVRRKKGTRVWADGVGYQQLKEVADRLDKPADGLLTRPQPKLVSPAGVEKLWGKSKPVREALRDLIDTKPGSLEPVPIDTVPAPERRAIDGQNGAGADSGGSDGGAGVGDEVTEEMEKGEETR